MYPSWENDFSAMNNDAISELVKQTAFKFSMSLKQLLDEDKLKEKTNLIFIGKNERELQKLFKENGDVCNYSITIISNNKRVECRANRRWSLQNVGYPYFGLIKESYKYRYPGISLRFKFLLNNERNIQQCNVSQTDITITKELR